MKVLLSCLQSLKTHSLPAYEFWRPYFLEGCREAGIECVEVPGVDWAEGLAHPPGDELDAWRSRTWDTVLAFARREHTRQPIDLFLGYLYPKQVDVTAISQLHHLGIPSVNFFCDNVREFRSVPEEYRPFSLHWVPEFEALSIYKKAGLPHLHAPMPCWVPLALRTVPTVEAGPPTFIGSGDILRRDLLGRALKAGADFVVRGPGWTAGSEPPVALPNPTHSFRRTLANQVALTRSHGLRGLYHKLANRWRPLQSPAVPPDRIRPPVFGQEYFCATREAMVTIGVNRVPTARASNRHPLVYSRLRDLEAPMLGACYLTERTDGLSQLYDLGVEIESYRTPDELADKLSDLTRDHARRRLMRERGQRRALADHSVARSLYRIGERLCLKH